jgi:hypothetical protein
MHFFIKPKIHLDAFTYSKSAIEVNPIEHGNKYLPKWWKELPKQLYLPNDFFPQKTMKTCYGLHQYYDASLCIPLWSELALCIQNGTYSWQFADNSSRAEMHNKAQYTGFVNEKESIHLKLEAPWIFETKKDIRWILSHPIYNTTNFYDYAVCPGVLNFHKSLKPNIQLMINVNQYKTINIEQGTPMAFITPMSEAKVVIHRHLIDKTKYEVKESIANPVSFINSYANRMKKTICPYKDHSK